MNVNFFKPTLITLGDSWTEGIGCYGHADPEFMDRMWGLSKHTRNLWSASAEWKKFVQSSETQQRAARYSWPALLSQQFDSELINLAQAGDSNSGQVKLLYELDPTSLQGPVQVIFMTTSPDRFSFYHKSGIWNYQPAIIGSPLGSDIDPTRAEAHTELVRWFVQSQDFEHGMEKESQFYIQAAHMRCQSLGWKFAWIPAFSNEISYQGSHRLHESQVASDWLTNKADWAVCGHPTEQGYQKISTIISQLLNFLEI
jgi:hypothetical protein